MFLGYLKLETYMSKEERGGILAITAWAKPEKPISEHDHAGFIKIDQLIHACNNWQWYRVLHDFIMADARGGRKKKKRQFKFKTKNNEEYRLSNRNSR